jgi:hypothetical protein
VSADWRVNPISFSKVARALTGIALLQAYMTTERRSQGWLVVFDARRHSKRHDLPAVIRTKAGTVRVVVVDINPLPPSRHQDN